MSNGRLLLVPVPIADDARDSLSVELIHQTAGLRYYLAERARTARRWLKFIHPNIPIAAVQILEIGQDADKPEELLHPALKGEDMGVISEAGCPAIADPGAGIVACAHRLGIKVHPIVGPSSILLALMGSGFSGQKFTFHGYLPVNKGDLRQVIRQLEQLVNQDGSTQLFMETPYRSTKMYQALIKSLSPATELSIAADLTGKGEFIMTSSVSTWKTRPQPPLEGKPAIFSLGRTIA